MKKLLIVDGNSVINRAFYALPPLKSNTGEISNAVYGFSTMIISAIEKLKPEYIVVAFDLGAPTFRHAMYDKYKANRHKMPEDLAMQLPMVKQVLGAMNITILEKEGIEADDIIGTVAKNAPKDTHCIILSGDKDLLQLVDKNITLQLSQRGLAEIHDITENNIKQVFGITAKQVIDLKALMGDSSDNIPGVMGIGEKTARSLIEKYSSVENIYKHIDEISGKLKEKLADGIDMAKLSYKLATIDTNCGVNADIEKCTYDFPFNNDVKKIFAHYNFKSLIARGNLFVNEDSPNTAQGGGNESGQIIEVNDHETLDQLLKNIGIGKKVAVYFDNMLWHFSFSRNFEYIVSAGVANDLFFAGKLNDLLSDKNIVKIVYDAKDFLHNTSLPLVNFFDVSLALYIVNQSDRLLSVKEALESYGLRYENAASALFVMQQSLYTKLETLDELELYFNIELPLVEVLYHMEKTGFRVNKDALGELSKKYEAELLEIQSRIYVLAGQEFNVNSPQQLSEILFNKLKLKFEGKKSTNIEVLESIEDQHEIVKEIIRHRKIAKLLNTYLLGFLPYLDSKNKVHTTFLQAYTNTGRLASRSPNLQNIPIRDDESRELRKLFISSFDDGSITSADYNQIELRLMAHMSGDTHMLEAFNLGQDIHAATAAKIYGVGLKDVTGQMRRVAKTVNFGIIYGISQYGLSKTLGIHPGEAKAFIEKYFETYPDVKKYMDSNIALAKQKGYAETLFKRKRYIKELESANPMIRKFGERVAINTPLQGSASDFIKIAMLKVADSLKKHNLKSKLILQIHDELIIDTFDGEQELVAKLLKQAMENVYKLNVPLIVDISNGKDWYECK